MTESACTANTDADAVVGNESSIGFVSVSCACEGGELADRCSAISNRDDANRASSSAVVACRCIHRSRFVPTTSGDDFDFGDSTNITACTTR